MRRKNRVFRVKVNIPEGVTDEEMRDYIKESVESWNGSFNPGTEDNDYADRDPFCDLGEIEVS